MLANKLEGAAAAALPVYVEDVFSTYLYNGNSSTQTITNGIDLSGKGGLVWIKSRSATTGNRFTDTTRGATKSLESNSTAAEATESNGLTAFNADGFTIGSDADYNKTSDIFTSWTFRKQAKFFDVVTWTGNDVFGRSIPHSLGSRPGMIIVKTTSTTSGWSVWHRFNESTGLLLNTTDSISTANQSFGTNQVTSTEIIVGPTGWLNFPTNNNGVTYVAYLFAHDAGGFGASGTDNVISCGSYTGNASTTGPIVTLGYEPQWVMVKAVSAGTAGNWTMLDSMRALNETGYAYLRANTAEAEVPGSTAFFRPLATGFQPLSTSDGDTNNPSGTVYIYIAIRRGPMRTPTDATKVFYPTLYQGTNVDNRKVTTTIAPDMVWIRQRNDTVLGGMVVGDRLRGQPYLLTGTTDAEVNDADSFDQQLVATTEYGTAFSAMDGIWVGNDATAKLNANVTSNNHIIHAFKRAPGFFDVVHYTGTGSNLTINHNLGVVPEMILVKKRSGGTAKNWGVYHAALSNTEFLTLSNNNAKTSSTAYWNSTTPSSTTFSIGTSSVTNDSFNYVAYLFASLTGVSKVGSYTGNGSSQTINCGFTAGARFVLIKRTDSAGNWFVFDSARGIVSGNDPFLLADSTTAESTAYDAIDPHNSGFIVNNDATNFPINESSATYVYLAIA